MIDIDGHNGCIFYKSLHLGGGAIIDDLKLTKNTNLVFSDPRYLLISFYSLGNSFNTLISKRLIV